MARFPALLAPVLLTLAGGALWISSAAAYIAELSPAFLRLEEERYGPDGLRRIERWRQDERRLPRAAESFLPILAGVNALGNRIPYIDDQTHWGQSEYWATPAEFVASGGGDCEDFAIAKYFALRAAGVTGEHLRMTYVRALLDGRVVNHMVLAFYEHPDAEPLILDNLRSEVLPASRRQDLVPVFSFNDDDPGRAGRDGAMARRWRDLRERIEAERKI